MANGRRGGIGTLGFPQFNAGGQGGVIPQLQLRPAPINFPRAGGGGGGGRRQINPAVAFLPGIVGALGNRFLPQPAVKQRVPTGDDRIDRVLAEADLTFGAEREDPTLFQELLPLGIDALIAGSLGDRGGAAYAQTALDRRVADLKNRRDIEGTKRQFIKEQLEPESAQRVTLIDADKIKAGVVDTRRGFFLPKEQRFKVFDPKNPKANEDGFAYANEVGRGNWLDADQTDGEGRDFSFLKDPQYVQLFDFTKTQKENDDALLSTYSSINKVVKELDKAIEDPSLNPATTITTALGFVDDLYANIDQVFKSRGKIENSFSQDPEDSGVASQELWLALSTGNEEEIDAATKKLEGVLNINLADEQYLGSLAYSNIQLRANMLTLAYAAAASAGQTGRTLSDRDLALFLQIVGFGASQNPLVLKERILSFGDAVEERNNNRIPVFLPKRGLGVYDLTDTIVQSTIGDYYTPSKNEQGEDNWSDIDNYTQRNFGTRYKDVETYKKFKSHKRGAFDSPKETEGTEEESILEQIDLFPNR